LELDKSAAIFRHRVAEYILDMFCNFYLVKNHKIVSYSTTAEGGEKSIGFK
jgi:hypothetical protein